MKERRHGPPRGYSPIGRTDDDGIETIEYALITIIMVTILVVGFPFLTSSVDNLLQYVVDQFAAVDLTP